MVSDRTLPRSPRELWTWGGALFLLLGGAVGAQTLGRSVSAADLALESLALPGSEWRQVQNEVDRDPAKGWPEAKQVRQAYEDAQGHAVSVVLKATYTRVGALRDYSLGRVADGWVVEQSAEAALSGVTWGEQPLRVKVERLRKGNALEVAMGWYCSPDEVVTDLRGAALAGWRGRLLGPLKPWAQVYVVAESTAEEAAEADARVQEAALGIAPQVKSLLDDATR